MSRRADGTIAPMTAPGASILASTSRYRRELLRAPAPAVRGAGARGRRDAAARRGAAPRSRSAWRWPRRDAVAALRPRRGRDRLRPGRRSRRRGHRQARRPRARDRATARDERPQRRLPDRRRRRARGDRLRGRGAGAGDGALSRRCRDAEIEHYLRAEQPYDCAGSAKCETLGIALLEAIESDDPTALVGLPLIRTCALLRAGRASTRCAGRAPAMTPGDDRAGRAAPGAEHARLRRAGRAAPTCDELLPLRRDPHRRAASAHWVAREREDDARVPEARRRGRAAGAAAAGARDRRAAAAAQRARDAGAGRPTRRAPCSPRRAQGHDIGLLSRGRPAGASPTRARRWSPRRTPPASRSSPCPAPSSLLLALAASGLNGQSFAFVGYLPVDAAERARAHPRARGAVAPRCGRPS